MYATRTTTDCRFCGMADAECGARGMFRNAGACCHHCRPPWRRAHRERVERREQPEPPSPPPVVSVAPHPLDAAEEAEIVAGILRRAELDDAAGHPAEMFDRPSTAAYRALARSRGLDLADVVTAAVRGELADVVRRPAIATDEPPPPATAGRTPQKEEPT